jgi:hypothetical protein
VVVVEVQQQVELRALHLKQDLVEQEQQVQLTQLQRQELAAAVVVAVDQEELVEVAVVAQDQLVLQQQQLALLTLEAVVEDLELEVHQVVQVVLV